MPLCAPLWRNVEIWLNENVDNSLKISEKDKMFGCHERNSKFYLINVTIFATKLVIYRRRPDGSTLNLKDVLQTLYFEMLNDDYDCEIKLNPDLFEIRWGQCRENLLAKFA